MSHIYRHLMLRYILQPCFTITPYQVVIVHVADNLIKNELLSLLRNNTQY